VVLIDGGFSLRHLFLVHATTTTQCLLLAKYVFDFDFDEVGAASNHHHIRHNGGGRAGAFARRDGYAPIIRSAWRRSHGCLLARCRVALRGRRSRWGLLSHNRLAAGTKKNP
jgi:hypothetical protein